LRVLIEEAPKGKRWVAIAGDWPGLERNGKSEDDAVAKVALVCAALRACLETRWPRGRDSMIVGRHAGTGSTDFWGISFAPSGEDREPMDDASFERRISLLRAACAEFDPVAARVSVDLRPGVRGGGRTRDAIVRHVLVVEGSDFSKRVKAPTDFELIRTPGGARSEWRAENKPLSKWTIPYLLRHSAYHVFDRAWELEDRDLTTQETG
jgi:hypothetical protein